MSKLDSFIVSLVITLESFALLRSFVGWLSDRIYVAGSRHSALGLVCLKKCADPEALYSPSSSHSKFFNISRDHHDLKYAEERVVDGSSCNLVRKAM